MIKNCMLYMYFDGQCENALALYQSVFGLKIHEKISYGEAEPDTDKVTANMIMNSTSSLGGMTICACDLPGKALIKGDRSACWLEIDSEESFHTIYDSLVGNGSAALTVPETTFWNSLYAKIQDPYGFIWELNCQTDA